MRSRLPFLRPAEPVRQVAWPVRDAAAAGGKLQPRPETSPGLPEALIPGAVVVLAPEQAAARLWPEGGGTILVTTANPATGPSAREPVALPVGRFSPREAMSYLMGRLSADPFQRLGALGGLLDGQEVPGSVFTAGPCAPASPGRARPGQPRACLG